MMFSQISIVVQDFKTGVLPNDFKNCFVFDEWDKQWIPVDGFSIAHQAFTQGLSVLHDPQTRETNRYHLWVQLPVIDSEEELF